MPDVLPNEIVVDLEGRSYVFKIPTIHDEIKIGMRSRDLRREIAGNPSEDGLDNGTVYMCRACAGFEVLLKKSSETWPFSEGKAGPEVNSAKFSAEKVNEALEVYVAFQDKLGTFRAGGNPAQPPLDQKTVSG